MSQSKPTTITVARDREYDKKTTILPVEVARGVVIEHAPSAQALKLMHLMIAVAGGRMADDTHHTIRSAEIREIEGMRKHDKASLVPLFGELRAMTYYFDDTEKLEVSIGGFLDHAQVQYRHDDHGDITVKWWFSHLFKQMAGQSNYWAIIDRQTIFALRSKYSILLFQHLSSLFNLKHINRVQFTIPELRSVLNVEDGKITRFADLNRDVIKPMVSEINQLSRFEITAMKIKRGREVIAVEFSWEEKSELEETKRELAQPNIGRKARRNGTAEYPVLANPFPETGGLTYDRYWHDEAKRIWSDAGRSLRDLPDTKLLADYVRKKARDQKIALTDIRIERLFENILKAWR